MERNGKPPFCRPAFLLQQQWYSLNDAPSLPHTMSRRFLHDAPDDVFLALEQPRSIPRIAETMRSGHELLKGYVMA